MVIIFLNKHTRTQRLPMIERCKLLKYAGSSMPQMETLKRFALCGIWAHHMLTCWFETNLN